MNEKELRKLIREEVKKLTEASGPKWVTKNLDQKELYNFWAAAKHIHDDFGDYMTFMNKGKTKDAEFALKVGYDSLLDIKADIDKMIKAVKAELEEKNFLNN